MSLEEQETVTGLMSSVTFLDGFAGRAGDSNRLMFPMAVIDGLTGRAGDSNRF